MITKSGSSWYMMDLDNYNSEFLKEIIREQQEELDNLRAEGESNEI